MTNMKTKAISALEEKIQTTDASTVRHTVLQNAKSFKTSWIGLGQILYTVWRDKLYKNWGFTTFEAYTSKEIGIRKQTAFKLLQSYRFLEREEPRYLGKNHNEKAAPANIPTCDSVNVLRLALKKKGLDTTDYARLKENVLEKGKDARDVKKDLASLIREREVDEPEVARKKRRLVLIKRLISALKSVAKEIRFSKMLPVAIANDADKVISSLETEISTK